MNRSKDIGTRFETATVRWLRRRLDDDRIERRALHGSRDMGDVFGLHAHNSEGICECKAVKTWGPALLREWEAQTGVERGNADADFAFLVVKRYGVGEKGFGAMPVRATMRDLMVMSGVPYVTDSPFDPALDRWVWTDLETVCSLMEGVADDAL